MVYENDIMMSFYDMGMRGDIKLTALLKHINLAAGANADDLGIGINYTLSRGLTFVIQRFALRVYDWPSYRQQVKIRTWPAGIERGTFRRNGDMWDKNGKKLAEWTGLWVLIDVKERKVRRPKALEIELPKHGPMDVSVEAHKLEIPEEAKLTASYRHVVRFSDADINQHMTNAVYGDLIANVIEIAETPFSNIKLWEEIQFNYLVEAKVGEEINVVCRQLGDALYIEGIVEDKTIFMATVKTSQKEIL